MATSVSSALRQLRAHTLLLGAPCRAARRSLSSTPAQAAAAPKVFDRDVKRRQRDWAARRPDVHQFEILRDEIAWQVADRVADVAREFEHGLDLGCGRGHVGKHLDTDLVHKLTQCDLSQGMLDAFDDETRDKEYQVCCDDEALPFDDNTFDVVVSSLNLHWVNDLPGVLDKIKRILKPDGPFVGAMFGGDTLYELRCSLQLAELERHGGFAPRISPFVDSRDVGGLLQHAGFTLLTVDTDDVVINYPSMFELLLDLRGMAETNAALSRRPYIRSDTLQAAAAIYQAMYGNEDGTVPATFRVVHMVGWKPDPSQPTALRRGSAEKSLKDLGVDLETLQEQLK